MPLRTLAPKQTNYVKNQPAAKNPISDVSRTKSKRVFLGLPDDDLMPSPNPVIVSSQESFLESPSRIEKPCLVSSDEENTPKFQKAPRRSRIIMSSPVSSQPVRLSMAGDEIENGDTMWDSFPIEQIDDSFGLHVNNCEDFIPATPENMIDDIILATQQIMEVEATPSKARSREVMPNKTYTPLSRMKKVAQMRKSFDWSNLEHPTTPTIDRIRDFSTRDIFLSNAAP